MQPWLALTNSRSSHLSYLSAGITGIWYTNLLINIFE